ncbi:MAG TPA: lipoate--protein ligase family protein [Longimicrobiales bacterium]|nr:lipoate--protein ligase family protein [Longimicrobiales bacterium]
MLKSLSSNRASLSSFSVDAPMAGALNMALDHALLEQVQRDKQPVLRLYGWQPTCLSFGRNQPARGLYDAKQAERLGIDIVRRPTGGFAVLHAIELTYAFVAPADLLGGPRESYLQINRALVCGLRRFGVDAEISGHTERSAFGTVHPCFAEPAPGEVTVRGRKLVGSAQRCEKRTLLQHGSILLDGTQDVVAQIARVPFALEGRAVTLAEVLGSAPEPEELADAIALGFEEVCGICLAPEDRSASLFARAVELSALYQSPEWTWRR